MQLPFQMTELMNACLYTAHITYCPVLSHGGLVRLNALVSGILVSLSMQRF